MFNILKKTFSGLKKTRRSLMSVFSRFSGKEYLTQKDIDNLEAILFQSDLSYDIVDKIINDFKNSPLSKGQKWENRFIDIIKEDLNDIKVSLKLESRVILFVGVNGTGKTTTLAKLSNYYKNNGDKVIMVAADTFRAAAVDQLKIWAERLNVKIISNDKTKSPASVLYDGIESGIKNNCDRILVDTAGRLHNMSNLMNELDKMYKVAQKFNERLGVVLVLDSNVGQNGINQALQFNESVPLDGLILTKMDGTAKGGVVISLIKKLKIPVYFIGVGEGVDDIVPFNINDFLLGMISEKNEI